ncbi:RNA polymerase subunit sigma [Pseudolysobacter antarcticus]|uniref:RNA polymerase subunit sigma n=1 Tax=Pseudolysobacter antarcticus TaxID=2511995 RepID=A0A411HGP6_9GAMM|nr:ECF-type sigma factor [Pseudolysobacter antarcticus]QBB69617.1 RNA polymerase subunit sigma [Pseudolysobacter antarcticus]
MTDRPAVTELLVAYERGDSSAQEQLFSVVYDELKRIARGHVRRSSGNLTVNPTALVHEAWIKITRGESRQFNDSVHFYNLLAQAMRHVILDLAKRRSTERHGQGFARTELSEEIEQPDRALDELLAVDAGLVKLQACDAELAQLVEWHFFCGLSFVDIAAARGVTERTVRRHWEMARLFLVDAIGDDAAAV